MNKWTLLVKISLFTFIIMFQVAILTRTYIMLEPIRQYNKAVECPDMSIRYCPYCGSEVKND